MCSYKPQTTYYYKVDSEEANGRSDGVKSTVNQFTTAGPASEDQLAPNQMKVRVRAPFQCPNLLI